MKIKKLFAIAAAAVMAFSALPAIAAGAVTDVPAKSFWSVNELTEYLSNNNGNVVINMPSGGQIRYDNVESIQIPSGLSEYTDNIIAVHFTDAGVDVIITVSADIRYELYNFGTSETGRKFYNDIKRNKKAQKFKVDGRTVYHFYDGEYFWIQNGNYYRLRTTATDGITHCSAEDYVLPEYSDEGLTNIYGGLYYVEPDGGYYVGWKTLNGKKYFFGMDGRAVTYNTIIGNTRYTFDPSGVCTGRYTGWLDKDGYRYYYKNGRYVTGVYKVDNKTYTFSEYGILMY